jgi:hypothetical protein
MANKTDILEQFNNEQVLGKKAGNRTSMPGELSLNTTGSYSVGQFSYPENLSESADLQHYVAFFINVRGKTKFKPSTYIDVDVSSDAKAENRNTSTTGSNTALATAAIATGTSVAGLVNKVLGGIDVKKQVTSLAKSGSSAKAIQGILMKKAVKGMSTSAVAGMAAGAAAAGTLWGLQNYVNALKVDTPKRLKEAIVLHMQSAPTVSYSVEYDKLDMGILGGLLGGSSAIDTTKSALVGEYGAAMSLTAAGLPKAAMAGQILGMPSPRDALLASAKAQTNPFRETIFKAVNQREFSFQYTFLPKSEKEVYNVKRIIDLFKFHMHPELSAGGLFYVYPSEFEIVYYYKGAENSFINKISTCVLKDMQVKYGGEYFASFKGGEPAEISLTLKFQELEILTKERIVKGF